MKSREKNDQTMNDSRLVELISVHMDRDVLKNISQTSLWSIISPLLRNQHFWYMRTLTLINFYLEWNATENWHQVYDILLDATERNPFSEEGALSLKQNDYNLLAVKTLLRLGYDPSVDNNLAIVLASEFGSLETVRLLLEDKRVDPSVRHKGIPTILDRGALVRASKLGRCEVVKLLLEDKRINRRSIQTAVRTSCRNEQEEVLDILLQSVNEHIQIVNMALEASVDINSLGLVKLVLRFSTANHPTPDLNRRGYVLNRAVQNNNLEMVLILLEDKRLVLSNLTENNPLLHAATHGNLDIMNALLSSSRVSKSQKIKHRCLELAIKNGRLAVVELLLEDKKLKLGSVETLLNLALEAKNKKIITTLLRDERIDPGSMPGHMISHLVPSKYLRCIAQAGHISMMAVLGCITKKNDYSSLLRELMIRRLDLEYYLKWILKRCRDHSTRDRTRIAFSGAARSLLSDEPVVHTSPHFTAYRGFMLLSVDSNERLLYQEEGVTARGLSLAGMLTAAYLNQDL